MLVLCLQMVQMILLVIASGGCALIFWELRKYEKENIFVDNKDKKRHVPVKIAKKESVDDNIPRLYDRVKNKKSETTGVVVGVYNSVTLFPDIGSEAIDLIVVDVRTDDEKIRYRSPIANWELISRDEHAD